MRVLVHTQSWDGLTHTLYVDKIQFVVGDAETPSELCMHACACVLTQSTSKQKNKRTTTTN